MKNATPDNLSLPALQKRFPDEAAAIAYLETIHWPNGPVCQHCGNADAAQIWTLRANGEKKIRVGLRQCALCKNQFRVTVGTIYEKSHIPLHLWIIATYIVAGAKKGISALQMQRHLGLGSYKSAWFMVHRIRHAVQESYATTPKMCGVVEMDETYIGGKKRAGRKPGRPGKDSGKTPVVTIVEREGDKHSEVMERITIENLNSAVEKNVEPGTAVVTDAYPAYRKGIPTGYKHYSVNHSADEFARQEDDLLVHTNTVESSFSLLKRGIMGAFHHVSKKHLPLYLAEFDFRWNMRKTNDSERCVAALRKADGKRIRYKTLTAKVAA